MTATDRPLASVIVPVFRHQSYLEPAINSILSFDYQPLEIVIRDDASPDDAFDVLQRLVDAYDGPHKVKLGRNEQNMSMANFNALMEEATGRYIVVAHDDDIQRADRVSRIMDVYTSRRVSMVTSNMINIGRHGRERGLHLEKEGDHAVPITRLARNGWVKELAGPALSWDREIFDRFGPIDIDGTARTSDFMPPFRAALLEGIHYLEEPLVYRRQHPNRRGRIGRNKKNEHVTAVDSASEGITQLSYMLRTLKHFEDDMGGDPALCAEVRDLLLLRLEELAEKLGTHRNRLHMQNKKMVWIERELDPAAELDKVRRPKNGKRDGQPAADTSSPEATGPAPSERNLWNRISAWARGT